MNIDLFREFEKIKRRDNKVKTAAVTTKILPVFIDSSQAKSLLFGRLQSAIDDTPHRRQSPRN